MSVAKRTQVTTQLATGDIGMKTLGSTPPWLALFSMSHHPKPVSIALDRGSNEELQITHKTSSFKRMEVYDITELPRKPSRARIAQGGASPICPVQGPKLTHFSRS